MATFSQRYGYVPVNNVLIREHITEEIQNAICNTLNELYKALQDGFGCNYYFIQRYAWRYFLNRKTTDFNSRGRGFVEEFIQDPSVQWYYKIDLLESIIQFVLRYNKGQLSGIGKNFIKILNSEFARLNYAYRIIETHVVEITSEEEITTIQTAIDQSQDNVKLHLQQALQLLANRENPDYRNSIKESISAVEAICRELTNEDTLGKALKKLTDSGIQISERLKTTFVQLYAYTNQPDTGIRHALLDEQNAPTAAEAIFMLVSCSAFANYLRQKTV